MSDLLESDLRGVEPDPILGNRSALGGVLAIVVLVSAVLPAGVRAQAAPPYTTPPSPELLQQMRQELEALKAEEARAKAEEARAKADAQDRARRIDALAQKLGVMAG